MLTTLKGIVRALFNLCPDCGHVVSYYMEGITASAHCVNPDCPREMMTAAVDTPKERE